MNLQDWHKFGWVKPHQTSFLELSNLLAIVDRDIADATEVLSMIDFDIERFVRKYMTKRAESLLAADFAKCNEEMHRRIDGKAANPVNVMGATKKLIEETIMAYSDRLPIVQKEILVIRASSSAATRAGRKRLRSSTRIPMSRTRRPL